MKWFARDDRHSSEVFRVFGVKFQFSPKPAETPTVQVRHVTEQLCRFLESFLQAEELPKPCPLL